MSYLTLKTVYLTQLRAETVKHHQTVEAAFTDSDDFRHIISLAEKDKYVVQVRLFFSSYFCGNLYFENRPLNNL